MSKQVFSAYKNVELRKSIHNVVKPLDTDGIEQIDFYHDQKVSVNVQKKDYEKFAVPEVKEKQLDIQTAIMYLQIINVAFEHGKWKFSDGSNQFFAEIHDEKFLEAVKKNEQRFG